MGSPIFSIKRLSEKINCGDMSPTELIEVSLNQDQEIRSYPKRIYYSY